MIREAGDIQLLTGGREGEHVVWSMSPLRILHLGIRSQALGVGVRAAVGQQGQPLGRRAGTGAKDTEDILEPIGIFGTICHCMQP